MSEPLWSDSKIDEFLAETVGKERLPQTSEEFVKFAGASARVIVADYEKRNDLKRQAAEVALEQIDKILLASTGQVSPQLRAMGLHLALESLRISFLIVRDF
jgi:hypothetical protein